MFPGEDMSCVPVHVLSTGDGPNFGYGFGFGTETSSKLISVLWLV